MFRESNNNATITRVYQYGAIPLDLFPKVGIDALFQQNCLWNQLIHLHNENREEYERARYVVDEFCTRYADGESRTDSIGYAR